MTAVDAQALADTVRETLLDFAVDSIARTGGNQGQYGRRESALAALDGLVEALGQRDEALRMLVAKAMQYMDTGRGDLDGAIDHAEVVLASPVPVRGDEQ